MKIRCFYPQSEGENLEYGLDGEESGERHVEVAESLCVDLIRSIRLHVVGVELLNTRRRKMLLFHSRFLPYYCVSGALLCPRPGGIKR